MQRGKGGVQRAVKKLLQLSHMGDGRGLSDDRAGGENRADGAYVWELGLEKVGHQGPAEGRCQDGPSAFEASGGLLPEEENPGRGAGAGRRSRAQLWTC